jgi:hypothetical protein
MKHYIFNGKTYDTLPDPLHTEAGEVSPMTEKLFKQLGGTIEDDGQPTPEQQFFSALNAYLNDLEAEAERLALDISIDEFKAAAGSMMSSELIEWAKSKQVPDSMIDAVRPQILTFIADASRLGMTWSDIFPKPAN